jgi:hypothetical protein
VKENTAKDSKRIASRGDKAYSQCKKLIACLLFINTSVLAQVIPGKRNFKDELNSHNKLIDWLFDEIFCPGPDRFPLLGDFKKMEGIQFGEVQRLLILHISGELGSNSELEASLNILNSYYMAFQDHIFQFLKTIDNDLNLSLRKLLYNGVESNLIISGTMESINEDPKKLRGLKSQVMPLEKFPEHLKPKGLKGKWEVSFEPEELAILERFDQLIIPNLKKPEIMKNKVDDDLPISACYTKEKKRKFTSKRFIWIVKSNGEAFYRKQLKLRLTYIITFLKCCHLKLSQYLKEQVPEINENLQKEEFFNWINELLMGKVNLTSPIFGDFVLPGGDDKLDKDFEISASCFSDAQIDLIEYFASSDYT